MQLSTSTEMSYKQQIPPVHTLKVNNYSRYTLHQTCYRKFHSQALTVKYDYDDQFVAIGCRDGARMLYCLKQHKIVEKYQAINQNSVTSVKWRPKNNSNTKILATTDSEGYFTYWHIPTMKKIFSLHENQNTILCTDFSVSGGEFATAGKDANIRIYDQQTKTISVTLKNAQWNNAGHDNRIFAVKFVDDNTLISGGWDSVVHIWDLREGLSKRHFYGPHVSGQSIDYQDGKILVGCYAAQNQLQIWDFNKCSKIQQLDWTGNIDNAAYIYTASYSKHTLGLFGAGSTGKQAQVRLYQDRGFKNHNKLVNDIKGVNEAVFSLDFSRNKNQFSFSTAHHGFYVYDFEKNA